MAADLMPVIFTLASCQLPSDFGTCRNQNLTVNWFYDHKQGNCRRFWYGGCGGNENRFASRIECIKNCVRRDSSIKITDSGSSKAKLDISERCSLEKSRGKCGNFTLFYYFDTKSISCSPFWYGGCGGNDNRFATVEECKEACRHTETVLKANRAAALNAGYESTSETPDPTSQTQNRTEKTGSESQTPRQGSYPSNITFVTDQDNQGSVILSWQAPTVSDGNITGYAIYYSTDHQKDIGGWIVKVIVSSRLSTVISNLQADTTYYFRMQSRNRYSYSPLTDIVTYRSPKVLEGNDTAALNAGYESTSEAPDPNSQTQNRTEKTGSKEELYPHNITFVTDRDNQGSVILSWQAPTVSDGNITDYVIRYTEGGPWIQKYMYGIGNTLSTSITDLKADTTYFFRIQAVTREGTGPRSDQATYRTPKGKNLQSDPVEVL
ncbi:hypothetical protein SNE40_010804 [Patella caerulea]|uniref:Uncharacterized protein n=1 Tax=Patella caerulea TaxID=87958 RepID=A0AAN8PT71_PATCE